MKQNCYACTIEYRKCFKDEDGKQEIKKEIFNKKI